MMYVYDMTVLEKNVDENQNKICSKQVCAHFDLSTVQ